MASEMVLHRPGRPWQIWRKSATNELMEDVTATAKNRQQWLQCMAQYGMNQCQREGHSSIRTPLYQNLCVRQI